MKPATGEAQTRIGVFSSHNDTKIMDQAREGFQTHGRGYVYVVLSQDENKPDTFEYVNQFADRQMVAAGSKEKIEALDALVETYDTDTEAVALVTLGAHYSTFLLSAKTMTG